MKPESPSSADDSADEGHINITIGGADDTEEELSAHEDENTAESRNREGHKTKEADGFHRRPSQGQTVLDRHHLSVNGTLPEGTGLRESPSQTDFKIERPTYTQESFDQTFEAQGLPVKTLKDRATAFKNRLRCTSACAKDMLFTMLPFIHTLRTYKPKKYLVNDLIAGLTVGIMHIPQGMAYGLLTTLPAVYGLYVSFFPVIIYFFLGTSRHISIGTFAVMSLMISSVVEKANCGGGATDVPTNYTRSGSNDGTSTNLTTIFEDNGTVPLAGMAVSQSNEVIMCKVGVATAVTFIAGIIQFCMGLLRLGFVTIYLSYPLTRGLTTGASIHVFTSQIKYVFGLQLKSYQGPLKLVYTYIDIFKNIMSTNLASLIMSIVCIVSLALVKEFANPKVKKLIKMPVPMELILVVAGTLTSYFWKMNERFEVNVVGDIPTGIPLPNLPPARFFSQVAVDAVSIALVSFAINVSLVKLFARKHNYKANANQELIAYGVCNSVSSMFNCYISAASLSRSLVQEGVGGQTQVVGLVSSALLLVVLFAIGPLFEQLPKCVLAAIIIVNLKGMFLQFKDLKEFWHISLYDFLNWIIVFIAVVLMDVDMGLGIGLGFSLLAVVFRTQRPYAFVLGRVPGTDIYKNVDVYPAAEEIPGVKIFRFESSLYFANVEHFIHKLFSKTGVNPRKLLLSRQKAEKKKTEDEKKSAGKDSLKKRKVQPVPEHAVEMYVDNTKVPLTDIIIDCSTMAYIDYMGVTTLSQVIDEYHKVGINVNLAGCKVAVRQMLEGAGFFNNHLSKARLFVSVHDAVLMIEEQKLMMMDQASLSSSPLDTRL